MIEAVTTLTSPDLDRQIACVQTAVAFLTTLFDGDDLILLRPIEVYLEDGKKKSRVDYQHIRYAKCGSDLLPLAVLRHLERSAGDHTNLFCGVCPRFGPNGRFDLAWQIRTVRCLWADIDHATVDEALERVTSAGLPVPSIVVNSGNGAHLYWLLDVPYAIDDVGDPPAVETEFVQTPDGRTKPRKYINQDGERVYLDQQRHLSRLSPKAQRLQDLVAGIAKSIGGDHTTDLSRLLRLPGTLNRKDERNGRVPVPCKLVALDAERRYPIETFERFAAQSPDKARRERVAKVTLPVPRKLSAKRQDRLHELIVACDAARVGQRSEADYAFCAYAIEQGIGRDDAWQHVANVGKFAQAGERYFDRTWNAAAEATRETIYAKIERKATRQAASANGHAAAASTEPTGSLDDGGAPHIAAEDGRTELANARRLAWLHGDSLHWCDTWGKWLAWDGKRWAIDEQRMIETKAKGVCALLRKQLASVQISLEEQEIATFNRFITASESYRGLTAAIALAKSERDIPVRVEALDSDSWLFNVTNGTLDLRTGELRPHDRADLLTKLCPTKYDPEAACPTWQRMLEELLPADVIGFLHRALGYTLTGSAREHILLFLYGLGANGKSTFLNTITEALGSDYAATAAPELLTVRQGESHPTERADLHGRRFVTSIETEEGRRWAEALIKQLTGGDPIKGRRMREDF